MLDEIATLAEEAVATAAQVTDLDRLAELQRGAIGKKSPFNDLRRRIGTLGPAEKAEVGQAYHVARERIERAFADRRHELEKAARRARLDAERLDLTEQLTAPVAGHLHLVSQAIAELEDTFVGMGFTVAEGPEVETDWHNFEALNFPAGHPARDMYDTLYVNHGPPGSTLLRTHTSPVQVRVMLEQPPPIYSVMPGRTFRQDTADATHLPVFHQIEGLVVDRGISFGDLAGTIDAFTKAYFGGDFGSRLRPSYFPFTEPSAEFDIRRPDGTWLELGGCGMVHPNVLRNVGIDPEVWSGFAFGFGIDRLATTRHGVSDLRELITNDIRFLEQF